MTQVRYQIALALNKKDNERLEALKLKGVKIIEVFRAGLDVKEKGEK